MRLEFSVDLIVTIVIANETNIWVDKNDFYFFY